MTKFHMTDSNLTDKSQKVASNRLSPNRDMVNRVVMVGKIYSMLTNAKKTRGRALDRMHNSRSPLDRLFASFLKTVVTEAHFHTWGKSPDWTDGPVQTSERSPVRDQRSTTELPTLDQ